MTRKVAAALRPFAGCLAAGLAVGVVIAGLGSRLVMRLLAVADPDARGSFTENGNQVGDITLGGTLGLVTFVGIPIGFLAGLIVFAVRRWPNTATTTQTTPVTGPLVRRGLLAGVVASVATTAFASPPMVPSKLP